MTSNYAHLPRALQMANERAERWKQRHDALKARVLELADVLAALMEAP